MEDPYPPLARRLRDERIMDLFRYGPPASESDLRALEERLSVPLPSDFKRFLREFGAAELGGDRILGFGSEDPDSPAGVRRRWRRRWPFLPGRLIPFAETSAWVAPMRWDVSYLCFDTRREVYGGYEVVQWTPRAARRERLRREEKNFLGWLEEKLEWEEENLDPPSDWRNNAGWERYWSALLSDEGKRRREVNWSLITGSSSAALNHLDLLRERSVRRILFAGNGISLEPHCFAHLGFEVTALDVSPSASKFVESAPVTKEHLSRFLEVVSPLPDRHGEVANRYDPEKSMERVEREYRPGGKLKAVTADLFEYAPEAPFDAIYSNRAVQGFHEEDLLFLARRFSEWLEPGGICLLETINVWEHYRVIEDAFRRAGFFIHGEEVAKFMREDGKRERSNRYLSRLPWVKRRTFEDFQADYDVVAKVEWESEKRRLDAGEKMVIPWHSSG